MTDTIARQVSEQVKRAMEEANLARPLPYFDYIPTHEGEPSHRLERVPFPCYTEREREVRGHPMLRRPLPMTAPPKPQHPRKYCEFHEQSGHTTTERLELKKALHELADKGQVLTSEQGACTTVPIMVFGGKEALRFTSPHNDPLVVEMKIASAAIRRIMIDASNSIGIITWDYLKKVTHPERGIVPLVYPILGFGEQEVNPTGMICLPVCFGDKLKSKNLEVDFLIVDVPTAYNVIPRRPTLHKTRKKEERTRKKRGLHIRLSTILLTLLLRSLSIQGVSCLIPYTLTLARRRNIFHLLEVTTFVLGPLALVYVVEVGLEIAILLKFLSRVTRTLRKYPEPLQAPPLAGAPSLSSRPLGHPDQPLAFPSATGTGSLVPPTFGTPPQLSPPERTLQPLSPPPREFEVPDVAKSQDLTNSWTSENLVANFILMKLVDGCWVLKGEPLTA
ncbi:hypothetical protein Cgig2_021257 [Carnegiea gigantea]|uniref:Uncharacterized protein n=1 Tax=Carnegiea gigantea TaxID=171969 RepID=A0A9Q1Q9W7_9CARY|nr:hypothetical protein Cgig2_021257 [Carnegiea gigantea]